jgi:hypothetical protein
MEGVLKSVVVPQLRARGFKGSFPHFRRQAVGGIDLLTFQFDRHGGGFVIEIARSPAEGITTHWGKAIAARSVTAWDVHPDERLRIKPERGAGTNSWFRYDAEQFEVCARQVLDALPEADEWWARHA